MTFAELLGQFVQRSLYSYGQLSELSGVPKNTIANWINGRVNRPHRWHPLLKLAHALQLSHAEADQLLAVAQHQPLTELFAEATAEEKPILSYWMTTGSAPFQALAKLPTFIGRQDERQQIGRWFQQAHAPFIYIHGMGGVGKTSLATYLAYQYRSLFPDGVLWAQLNRSDTMSLLLMIAGAYGVNASHYNTIASRSAIVRSILADKRALLILDDAESSEQVEPLLPPSTGSCTVLLTTRQNLAIADGWNGINLRPFAENTGDALALFSQYLPVQTVTIQQASLTKLANQAGNLPLALSILAARLSQGTPIEELLASLENSALNNLHRENKSIRAVFDISYDRLSQKQRLFFSLLGVFGGEDFGVTAAAAVSSHKKNETTQLLNQLRSLSLVQNSQPGRFQLHPLLREYAQEKHDQTPHTIKRMVAYYTNLVLQAAANPDGSALSPAHFAKEISNFQATLAAAAQFQWIELLAQAIRTFFEIFYEQGHLPLLDQYIDLALEQAEAQQQPAIASSMYRLRGRLLRWEGKDDFTAYHRALITARQTQDNTLIINALKELGSWGWRSSNLEKAQHYWSEALTLARATNNQTRLAELLSNLGLVHHSQGGYEQAIPFYEESLFVSKEIGHFRSQVVVLENLGCLYADTGEFARGREYFSRGEKIGLAHDCYAAVMGLLGDWGYRAMQHGLLDEAQRCFQDSLSLAHKLDHRISKAVRLADLGEIGRRQQQYTAAHNHFQKALTIATENQLPDWLPVIYMRLTRLAIDEGAHQAAQTWYGQFLRTEAHLHTEYTAEREALQQAVAAIF